uniref:ELMO domain-containing protein n=1 Tax=Bicosoecida sp. CB-2014 TaxID=1486930 RepID=A0A7S1GDN2_9STRA|mmetsp:Transcript_5639/g.20200  ORF Transcript_5639/g.20200 Transcript_5639/m.20200 type:complete len:344 (+) Transcript_5639:126-1157(+)
MAGEAGSAPRRRPQPMSTPPRAAFGSKGDGIIGGFRALRSFVVFVFTGLWRWLWKVGMRACTKQGELERLLSAAPHSPAMTLAFASALRASRRLADARARVLGADGPFDVEREAHAIIAAKAMSAERATFHTLLLPNLTLCLRQLNGAAHVCGVVARERATAFNEHSPEHMDLLRALWTSMGVGGGEAAAFERVSRAWTEIGFQNADPVSDLRGYGVLGLRNLAFFAREYAAEAARIVRECDLPYKGMPFAITGINMSAFVGELYEHRLLDWQCFSMYDDPAGPSDDDALRAFHTTYGHLLVLLAQAYRDADPPTIMAFPAVFSEFKDRVRAAAAAGALPDRL